MGSDADPGTDGAACSRDDPLVALQAVNNLSPFTVVVANLDGYALGSVVYSYQDRQIATTHADGLGRDDQGALLPVLLLDELLARREVLLEVRRGFLPAGDARQGQGRRNWGWSRCAATP